MVIAGLIYLVGVIVAIYAAYNTFERKNWEVDVSFIIVAAIGSWAMVVSILCANKYEYGKWWYV